MFDNVTVNMAEKTSEVDDLEQFPYFSSSERMTSPCLSIGHVPILNLQCFSLYEVVIFMLLSCYSLL